MLRLLESFLASILPSIVLQFHQTIVLSIWQAQHAWTTRGFFLFYPATLDPPNHCLTSFLIGSSTVVLWMWKPLHFSSVSSYYQRLPSLRQSHCFQTIHHSRPLLRFQSSFCPTVTDQRSRSLPPTPLCLDPVHRPIVTVHGRVDGKPQAFELTDRRNPFLHEINTVIIHIVQEQYKLVDRNLLSTSCITCSSFSLLSPRITI